MKTRICTTLLLGALFGLIFSAASVQAHEGDKPLEYNHSALNVETAFDELTTQGEWLGAYIGEHKRGGDGETFELFPGSIRAHIQGLVRAPRTSTDGSPIFYAAVSINPNDPPRDAYPGILVVEMKSFEAKRENGKGFHNGERLGSNRLEPGKDTVFTWPPKDENDEMLDRVIKIIETKSKHPSGMQMVGDILAVPQAGFVNFYDCKDPTNPQLMDYALPFLDSDGDKTGAQAAAITKLPDPDGRFLLLINSGEAAHFYFSYGTSFFTPKGKYATDIFHRAYTGDTEPKDWPSPGVGKELEDIETGITSTHLVESTQYKKLDKDYLKLLKTEDDIDAWPFKKDNYEWWNSRVFQNISFVNQGKKLFLIGAANSNELTPENKDRGNDELYLLQVLKNEDKDVDNLNPNSLQLEGVARSIKVTRSRAGKNTYKKDAPFCTDSGCKQDLYKTYGGYIYTTRWQANFNAGACAYVSPSGELLYYGASHFADGYMTRGANYKQFDRRFRHKYNDFFKIAEYGNKYVSSDQKCWPTLHLGGPYTISEGDGLSLSGEVSGDEPWVRMFKDDDYNGEMVMMDWGNQEKDDYNDFTKLDGSGFNDKMSSFFWCGPPGSTLKFFTDKDYNSGTLFTSINGSGKVEGKVLGAGNSNHDDYDSTIEPYNNKASSVWIEWDQNSMVYTYEWSSNEKGSFSPDDKSAQVTYAPGGGNSIHVVKLLVSMDGEEIDEATTEISINIVPPIAKTRDITVQLDATGSASITAADVDNGSYDAGGGVSLSVSPTSFDCGNVGPNTVILTVTDDYGSVSTATAIVTVEDNLPPNVQSNDSGTITPPDTPISFTATAEDNCAVASVEITSYDCYKIKKDGSILNKKKSCRVEINGDTITIRNSNGVDNNIVWNILATDSSGNTTEGSGAVLVVNPGKH